jgi:hypothetical protein
MVDIVAAGECTVTKAMVHKTQEIMTLLVSDGGPTPQLGTNPSGALEIQWVVNGNVVGVCIEPNGDWNLWAETAQGEEVVDQDYTVGTNPTPEPLRLARQMLAQMGGEVRHRVNH